MRFVIKQGSAEGTQSLLPGSGVSPSFSFSSLAAAGGKESLKSPPMGIRYRQGKNDFEIVLAKGTIRYRF